MDHGIEIKILWVDNNNLVASMQPEVHSIKQFANDVDLSTIKEFKDVVILTCTKSSRNLCLIF